MECFTNGEAYRATVLGPLYSGGEMKKEDIMRKSEKCYLNPNHKDCRLTIPSDPDKTSGRKKEEWAIQQAYEDEYIIRTERGMYKITDKGKAFVEDFSERLEHECARLDEEAEKSTQAFAGGMTAEEFLGLIDSSDLETPCESFTKPWPEIHIVGRKIQIPSLAEYKIKYREAIDLSIAGDFVFSGNFSELNENNVMEISCCEMGCPPLLWQKINLLTPTEYEEKLRNLQFQLGFSDDNLSDMFDDPDCPFELIRESDESLLSPSGIAILREIYKTNQVAIKARQAEKVMEKIKNQKP